ncbi:putative cation/H+ exchanger [Medicago truncatula]|uniref:Cation/H+ exchanger 3 n=1 Tax=Medicago truncatula TaxID=3880 RepID=A0A072U5W5_MEDTR|nr:cation/H+ exchanger 3 [Medicago truncatula]RHN50255.1 putative cation/H+ exchanger [Medicago truncatula]
MNSNITREPGLYVSVAQIDATTFNVCSVAPPNIVSDGIWGGPDSRRNPMKSALPVFEMQLLVIFTITQICNFFLKRLHFPAFIAPMLVGLILGPSIQHAEFDKYKKLLFPYGSQDILATISLIGYVLYIFTIGVQIDLSMVTRTGHKVWTIAIMGFVVPILFSFVPQFVVLLEKYYRFEDVTKPHLIVDIYRVVRIHSSVAFAVTATLLNELKILNSELGRLALSSAMVTSILGLSLQCIGNVLEQQESHMRIIFGMSLLALVVFAPLIFRPLMFWIIRHTKEGRPVDDGYIYGIILMVLGLGWFAGYINQEFALGAYVLGLAVPDGPPLGSALVRKLEFFGTSLLLPIFMTCCVMKADLSLPYTLNASIGFGIIICFTHIVKVIAYLISCLICKIPFKDALTLALILNAKGEVDLAKLSFSYDDKSFAGQIYAVNVISIMVVACIVKWSVKILYDPSRKYAGYQKRNIMSLKPDAELRLLACIHKQYNISAIIDALDVFSPTTEKPFIVDALHLIELVGRSSPIFISHRLQKTVSGSRKSYSNDVILALDLYEHDNYGGVTTHTYTAISPPTLMYEDVCQLALDKVASIIILPFHRRWTIDGAIESDDKNIRSLNCKVLEIAPCSIGILVSRSSLKNNSPVKLAMIYLGGRDDREALCLAKRAIRNPGINLVVYHLTSEDDHMSNLEYLLDNEALEEVKKLPHYGSKNVCYKKLIVNNSPGTSTVLRDIANEHDFFIVGRTHDSDLPLIEGLTKWIEFSELGVIGDLLASPDLGSRAGVLVVQQQVKDK